MPSCPQAHSGAPEALHHGRVPCPHYPTSPPMEHVSSHLSTSTPPSSSAPSWMAHISLVSGMLTWHWMYIFHDIHPSSRFLCTLQCTVTCGGGVQARTVQCLVQGKPSSGCALHLKPSMSQACNTNFCPQPEKKGTTLNACVQIQHL